MKSLFNKAHSQEFIARINALTPQTPALWGKMNVAQMLAHSQVTLNIAVGELQPKVNPVIRFLFAKGARKKLLGDKPFEKNLPTLGEAKMVDKRVFDEEKKKLIALVERFQSGGPEGIIKTPHPFFGPLSTADWDTLQVKHLNHHLEQFGA